MSYPQPIYSQVVPKSQYRAKNSSKGMGSRERPQNLTRSDFDPLNYNHGGNFQMLNATDKAEEKKESRKKDDSRSRRTQKRDETSEGKVEAYLRQNQISMRQQQHRHSAVRQAEHRVNLRSLPLNEAIAPRGHDRTPTDRHRGFPERERDGTREHRRERERDRELFVDGNALSPRSDKGRPVRKSSSAHKVTEPAIATDKRRFFCREWVFQKIAHCLEQRPVSKTCGALILGDAGSGKTALCSELSAPGAGPQARQQRALQRRMLARHFLQGNNESTLRPGEFIRSVVMQILSQSSRRQRDNDNDSVKLDASPASQRRNSEEEPDHERLYKFKHLDDDEEISKPLLADSEDQHSDDDECPPQSRRVRTIDRIHERDNYMDSMGDAKLSNAEDLPEILPRNTKPTNPFLDAAEQNTQDLRLYENHENLFLRNISQRQSKELRNSRLVRQSSEPLTEKKNLVLQKSLSEQKESSSESEKPKVENSPPKSRIPVSNFRYPNKNDPKPSSVESSPHKTKEETPKAAEIDKDLPEYQNVLKPEDEKAFDGSQTLNIERLLEKKRSQNDDCPPPIPSLPINPRTLIADAYYDKLLSEPEIQQALLPQNLEKNPDECFKKALLFPLLEIDPPKQCLFLLVDAIDEGASNAANQTPTSCHVSTLLARAQHLLPTWLLLVATAHQHSKHTTRMFTGFRKIVLDDLQRAHVSADVQRYVLARLDTEPRLRSRVSSDATAAAAAAAALDHLRIKSDGCLLYLEKVLDGVADGFIGLREIKEIPGTLNGLYLWLAQRLFHGRRFSKVRLLLEVLLAARCGVTEDMLYKCLLTKEYSVTRDDFNRRLHLLRRILVMEQDSGHLSLFHHSFASWLVDVKHCTRRYLCSLALGHKALAMYYKCTSHYNRLSPLETHNFVFHMTHLEQYLMSQKKNKKDDKEEILDLHTICLLWILDSGCDIETALKRESDTMRHLDNVKAQEIENKPEEKEADQESEGKDSTSVEPSTLESIMPELVGGRDAVWPRDRRVLRTLIELSRKDVAVSDIVDDLQDMLSLEPSISSEPTLELVEQQAGFDPSTVHDLVTRGHVDTLTVLLKRYGPAVVFAKNEGETDWSPLRAAAAAAQTEMVELLLEYGCDVDGVDSDNRTALRAAAWSGHEAVVERLLRAGAAPDKADTEGRTPLIAAAYMGHQDIVRLLLDADADIHHADHDGRTALSVAALCARGGACVSVLLERRADVARADRDNATPLLVAAFEGHTDICELLLEAEADIEWQDGLGRSALWAAAGAGHADTTRLLLYWGASVDNMDHEGRTVLTVAAAQGNVDVVRQLLDRGLDEHHRDNSGWTPLHYAAFEGHMEVCSALLEAGARADAVDNDGKSALMLAAQEGHAALAASLVRCWHAPLHQRAIDGKTPLRLAALEGHIETVRVLHALGADVDALDADRRSTLYVLALDNRLEMASFLITRCGADVHAPDHEGRTPLHVSAWQGHTEMVNLLIKIGGAAVDARDRCMRTALHAAAWRGRSNVLLALLTHGASVAAVCTQGATPLGIAAQEGHEECVLRLLQHGADPLQADHCGRTPAKVAWRAGHANICRLLERWTQPQPTAPLHDDVHDKLVRNNSPDYKRRSVHSSNSTKSSSNLTTNSRDQDHDVNDHTHDKASRANLSLSFVQQVARYGRGRRDREVHNSIPEHHVVEKDSKLRSYMANERDSDIPAYVARRRDAASPLYASPPRSPPSDPSSPSDARASLPPNLPSIQPSLTDTHFNRDTHMRIILGKDSKQQDRSESKNKRNGIVTNPAMRLVANVRNGLDSAAANIRRTGVALAASASSNNPAVKTNAFQWRKETPL